MSSPRQPEREPGLPTVLALYTLARLGLLALIAGALVLAGVPLLVAVLIALIVALPLSMFVFRGLRAQLDARLAESGRRRRTERAALRARLRGDESDVAEAPCDPRHGAASHEAAEDQSHGRRD